MPDGLEELEGGAPGAGPSANVAASALPREPARRQKVVKVCAASICFVCVCVSHDRGMNMMLLGFRVDDLG